MTAANATLAGRAAAEALMVDACTVTAQPAAQVYDPATDTYTTPAGTLRYTGPCKVKPRDNDDQVVDAGGQTVSLWPYVISVPMTVTDVDLNDVVTVTASLLEPAFVGRSFRVRQVLQGSFLTARRLSCEVQET